ncbi:MAG: CHAT domain-containing protein [Deltaproteobacteria bacterium]
MLLTWTLACEGTCGRSAAPVTARLLGAEMIALEGGRPVHYVHPHAELGIVAATHDAFDVRSDGRTLVSTSTRTAGAWTKVTFTLPGLGEDAAIAAVGRTWRLRPLPKTWPQLSDSALSTETSTRRERLKALLEKLEGPALLAAHVEKLKLIRGSGPEEYRGALEAWRAAAERVGMTSTHSRALRSLAFQALYAREFSEAFELLDRADGLDRSIDNDPGLIRTLNYRALIHAELGQYRKALQVNDQALALAQSRGLVEELAPIVQARASALIEIGRYEAAWTTLDHARPYFAAYETNYYNDRGFALARGMAAGAIPVDWPRVLDELARARALLERREHRGPEYAILLTNLLLVLFYTDDIAAWREILAALESLAFEPPGFVGVFTELMRGHLALRSDEVVASDVHFRAALARAERDANGQPSDSTWRAHYGLAQVADANGDAERTLEAYATALAHLEALSRRTQLGTDRASFIDDRYRLFVDAVDAFLRYERVDLALLAADGSRSFPYRVLHLRGALDQLDASTRVALRRALDVYVAEREALEKRAEQAELVHPAERAAFRDETAAMRIALQKRFDDAFALVENAEGGWFSDAFTVDKLTAALGPDEGMLVPWGDGQDQVWFAVRPDGVRVMKTRPRGPWWTSPEDATPHLYVATMAHDEAWSALGTRAENREWLTAATVSFVPFPRLVRRAENRNDAGAVIVADPTSDLPSARQEGEIVATHLLGALVLEGDAATRSRVLEAVSSTRHFHFAGHGVLNDEDPWSTHLALARGERLTLEDLFASRPRAQHIVLSGCDTGTRSSMGRTVQVGLAEAFLAAGASSVVATSRRVDDRKARRFMERFYDAGGATRPAAALRTVALSTPADVWSAYHVLGAAK